jgi:uncharacterized protein (DUF849 family)
VIRIGGMPATTVAALMGGDTRAAMEDARQYDRQP